MNNNMDKNEIIHSFEISQEENDYIQYLHFEVESYEKIMRDIIFPRRKEYTFDKEIYQHFMNEFKEANMKFKLAVNNVVRIHAPEYANHKDYYFNFSFDFNRVDVSEPKNTTGCKGECKHDNTEK